MTTGRHFAFRALAALALLALLAPVRSGLAQNAASGTELDAAPPTAAGSAGASDQVENWIRENLSDLRGEPAAESDASNAPSVSGAPDAPQASGLPAGNSAQPVPALAEPAATAAQAPQEPGGSINWAEGGMSFTAQEFVPSDSPNPERDRAMALRRATMRARKSLLEAVISLPLDGRRSVGDALDDAELGAVRTYLQNSRVEKRETPEEGGGLRLSVTALASLRGDLAELLMPSGEPFLGGLPESITLTVGRVPSVPMDAEQAAYRRSMAELGGFTGLVLDARGRGMSPALLPVAADTSGLTAFGPFQVAREDVARLGAAIYATHPAASQVHARVGKSPLVVRVLAISGRNKADMVIAAEDAELVRALFRSQDVRDHCRTAIILD